MLRKLYLSLIYPYIIYGVEVWGASSRTKLGRLTGLMDRCVRLLGGGGAVDDGMYRRLGLLRFAGVYEYFCLLRTFKYRRLSMAQHFESQYCSNSIGHNILTRSNINGGINMPVVHLTKYLNSFFVNSFKFWNKVPYNVKTSFNLHSFKSFIRDLLLV